MTAHDSQRLDQQTLSAIVAGDVLPAIPAYLSAQRWYGDKARTIEQIRSVRSDAHAIDSGLAVLLIVELTFSQGPPASYFVPLVVSASRETMVRSLVEIDTAGVRWTVSDAVHSPAFRRWLLESLGASTSDSDSHFRWSSTEHLLGVLAAARNAESRVSSAQQSNSSIIYGSSIIVKLFRRLTPGVNPEIELGRFLATKTSFRNTPLLLGDWTYLTDKNPPHSLAVAQTFVSSVGDGWSFVLDGLRASTASDATVFTRLGELSAQLHLALESASGDPDLSPERIGPGDTSSWSSALVNTIKFTLDSLNRLATSVSGPTAEVIATLLALSDRLPSRAAGFDGLIGVNKSRVHGDYHLGQTLRTTSGDFVILDFEGEPQRPIDERRAKTSPLKDVAGMLRSFGYARGAAERELLAGSHIRDSLRADLVTWERSTRRTFLDSYVATSRRGGARYLPASDDDLRQALAAWELDKALYEVNYELNNRPDWLELPLSAVLKLAL